MSLKLDKRIEVCLISDKVRFLSKNELFLYSENAENIHQKCSAVGRSRSANEPNENHKKKLPK
jgi:hypothetical protein